MQKIETLFLRDSEGFVVNKVNPACQGAIHGGWEPKRKYDGVACWLDSAGAWWVRGRVERGQRVPEQFQRLSSNPYGTAFGWLPLKNGLYAPPFDEALANGSVGARITNTPWLPGAYELVGPGIGNGTHRGSEYTLVRHRDAERIDLPRDVRLSYRQLGDFMLNCLAPRGVEGIVWYGNTGQLAKLKVRDFRPVRQRVAA